MGLQTTRIRETAAGIGGERNAKDTLWDALRGKRLSEIPFRRDQVLGSVTADYFSNQYHLVVSVNEPRVSSKHWYYAKQDAQLRHMGFRVLRFTNEEVVNDLPFVLDSIVEVVSRIARRQCRI
jgi:very-short-patch-repair endonuclease